MFYLFTADITIEMPASAFVHDLVLNYKNVKRIVGEGKFSLWLRLITILLFVNHS